LFNTKKKSYVRLLKINFSLQIPLPEIGKIKKGRKKRPLQIELNKFSRRFYLHSLTQPSDSWSKKYLAFLILRPLMSWLRYQTG